jgi:hypothetical protein
MLPTTPTIKQELLSRIEHLPDYKLQEVLDFVEFLLFKTQSLQDQAVSEPPSSSETLQALNLIRETVQRTYGEYQGDLLDEARAEREKYLNFIGVTQFTFLEAASRLSYSNYKAF